MWIYHNCVSFAACVSWVIALPLRLVPAAVLLRMPSFIFLNSDLWIPRWFGSKKKREQRAGEALLSVNSLLKKERKKAKEIPLVAQSTFKSHLWFFSQLWSKQYWFTCIFFSYLEKIKISSSLVSLVQGKCAVYCWKGGCFLEVSVRDARRKSKPKVTASSRGSSKIWFSLWGDRWCFSLK